ncbi:hypothetical protein CRM22_009678 [Opisthorchis felineus]|uniref:Rho GDP-dissociation inhibitor n=1 Tax=Opisthorchis felineus TaxID=147828 RepID=A0A4S2LD65_OPIFE|nr:hypothetical protein CRM22_009678 [Opisthorchis felineus]
MSAPGDEVVAEDDGSGYKVPAKKTLEEIKKMDEEDESLRRYKEALLGSAANAVPFPQNPKSVILESFTICVENQPERTISLIGALADTTCEAIPIPEGANYHIKVNYYVQRDIVTGLQYAQSVYRGPVRVDRSSAMMGSYAPQNEVRVWKSDTFEAPKGTMHRGTYHIKSRFVDADKNEYVSWKWDIQVVKASG